MKVKFTNTEYDLITRELQDARLCLTFMKDEESVEDIISEIRLSESILILRDILTGEETDADRTIAKYDGFSDLIVIKEFDTGALSVELINNYILSRTMEVTGRVTALEETTSEISDRTQQLEETNRDFEQSQDNQDEIIEDILGTM